MDEKFDVGKPIKPDPACAFFLRPRASGATPREDGANSAPHPSKKCTACEVASKCRWEATYFDASMSHSSIKLGRYPSIFYARRAMKLIPGLSWFAGLRSRRRAKPHDLDHGDMGTAFGLDAIQSLFHEPAGDQAARVGTDAQQAWERRLTRRTSL